MSAPLPERDLDAHIAEMVADWPPLSDEVCNRLAVLLRPNPPLEQSQPRRAA